MRKDRKERRAPCLLHHPEDPRAQPLLRTFIQACHYSTFWIQ